MTTIKNNLLVIPIITLLSACGSQSLKPIDTVEHVELKHFMGDWYVIAIYYQELLLWLKKTPFVNDPKVEEPESVKSA